MRPFAESLIARARADKQTIVLPEGDDRRTLIAAETILREDAANVIILSDAYEIAAAPYNLEGAQIIDPRTDSARQELADAFYELRKHKGMTPEKALEMMDDVIYFGTMMVKQGMADGMVTGACHPTSHVLRASLQILKTAPGFKFVSTFMVMVMKNDTRFGMDGVIIFSDCGLNINPDPEMLANIGIDTARNWEMLTETPARVAFLCHSTYGSAAKNPDRDKVIEAVRIAKELAPDIMLDGEMQFDAAIIPSVGASKAPDSPVAGKANVLIFPDLDAGNIAKKAVKHLAGAEAYGPVTQGIAYPVGDLSRGATVEDIIGNIAIVCIQSQNKKREDARRAAEAAKKAEEAAE